jgi:class 3 adenylate cyclase
MSGSAHESTQPLAESAAERASYAPAHVQRRARDASAPFKASEGAALEAAVLFADISGFTPLSSKLAAQPLCSYCHGNLHQVELLADTH